MIKSLKSIPKNKYQLALFICSTVVAVLLALYTLHDLQTAEGAGLYLSMIFGQSQRTIFDILVDVMGMLLLFAMLLLPGLLLKHMGMASFFRFMSVYLAFMPIVHPGNVVHLGNSFLNMSLRQNISEGNLLQLLFVDCAPAFDALKYTLPLLLLLHAMCRMQKLKPFEKSRLFVFFIIVLFVLYLLFGETAETTLYLLNYLLIVWCFAKWEALCKHSTSFGDWSIILFIGCMLRGIYRMLELISHAHL